MMVFHFLPAEWALKDIKERRLKISRISDLNDPFEFLAADLRDRDFRKNVIFTLSQLNNQFGLICFSKSWGSPVQWSHYADRHRGICLGFEVPDDCLDKIKYQKSRILHDGEMSEQLAKRILCTKFKQWSYESEYRAFMPLDVVEDGHYYSDFDKNLQLVSVIVGANAVVTRKQVNLALGDIIDEVEVFKARAAFRSFRVVRNKNESLWA